MYLKRSAGKRVWRSQDWFWFYSVIGWKSGASQEPINNQCVSTLEWKSLWQSRETQVLLVEFDETRPLTWNLATTHVVLNGSTKAQLLAHARCRLRWGGGGVGWGHLKRTRVPFLPFKVLSQKKPIWQEKNLTINFTSRNIVNYGIEGTWSNPLHRY